MTERRRIRPISLELLNRSPFDPGRSNSARTVCPWRIHRANSPNKEERRHTKAVAEQAVGFRKNTSEAYRGRLIVYVRKSAELYRRMEGAWYGIVLGATSAI
ncbi:hypothetical protein [Streptomyces sp. A30]|uniref:hypothetical protein n=1 Tax=Streptomyces sp. A30 TaxID=2789273 RepID=UPI00397EC72E